MLKRSANTGWPTTYHGTQLWHAKARDTTFLDRSLWRSTHYLRMSTGQVRPLKGMPAHQYLFSFHREWRLHSRIRTKAEAQLCNSLEPPKDKSLTYVSVNDGKGKEVGPCVLLNAAVPGKPFLMPERASAGKPTDKEKAYCYGAPVQAYDDFTIPYYQRRRYTTGAAELYDGTRFLALNSGQVFKLAWWAEKYPPETHPKVQLRFHVWQGGKWQMRPVTSPGSPASTKPLVKGKAGRSPQVQATTPRNTSQGYKYTGTVSGWLDSL